MRLHKAGAPLGSGRSATEGARPPCADSGMEEATRRKPCRSHGDKERRRVSVRSAVLAPLLALALPAAVSSAEGDPAPPAPAAREQIPQGAALPLLGRDVKGPSGEVVAQIVNMLVDGSGRPLAAVLDYGGFMGVGKRRIAVVWEALRFAPGEKDGTVTLGLTRDQLKDFPEAKRGEPVVVAAPAAKPPK